ncbi:hypothetical protein PRZ48_004703 [Zasmidium cellare]|uniref:Lysine-specific metallo-endopeptidase domain-containing protein n=1 Tax=Zasmidium cellare TaxID=395010 RepID=A0ABR0ERQ6_ZASCE|nr:hypothetical protein PRZ48_004703 [Zasmidium cellare]
MFSLSKILAFLLAAVCLAPAQEYEGPRNVTCTEDQKYLIQAAIAGGRDIVNSVLALRTLGEFPEDMSQMTASVNDFERKYFGGPGHGDRQFIIDMFTFVNNSWDQRTWSCPDSCKDVRARAFVKAKYPTTVFICPYWFERGTHASALYNNSIHAELWTSRDSVLIHEMLHTNFDANGKMIIRDQVMPKCIHKSPCKAYGSEKAHVLSVDAPDRALRNADNYMFYALDLMRVQQNALRAVSGKA